MNNIPSIFLLQLQGVALKITTLLDCLKSERTKVKYCSCVKKYKYLG